jgi:magnesium chelatase subunit D
VLRADTVTDRIAGVLSCLARDHRLGGVLFLDLRPELLHGLAGWLRAAIADGGAAPRIFAPGADESDDSLWWQVGAAAVPVPGPLTDRPDAPLIAVIPDLSRANLAVTRAATVLAGADWAVTDRHGLHAEWQPRSRWLAACATADVERLSPHLLDRFPVRVAAATFGTPAYDPDSLLAALDDAHVLDRLPGMPPPVRPAGPIPPLTPEVARLVTELVGDSPAPHRRDLALARAARTVAISDRAAAIGPRHARRAAELLGLVRPDAGGAEADGSEGEEPAAPEPASAPVPDAVLDEAADEPDVAAEWDTVAADDDASPLVAGALPPVPAPAEDPREDLYPEDRPGALPDFASLRLTWRYAGGGQPLRGPIIGAQPARRPVDIAYVATILEAAKFRVIRHGRAGRLRVHPSDLRSHRRVPLPDAALVLVLDHSCGAGWDVAAALAPYLRWAYTKRAALSLVELGHLDAADRLKAVRSRLSGVLDGALTVALARRPGPATPLAHGLDLAVQEMRLRQRNMPIRDGESWLVVVSDGRGNVPLEASQRDVEPRSVGRRGVEDALVAAAGVPALRRVRAVVLAPPELSHYRDLPFALADAMGGLVARPADRS